MADDDVAEARRYIEWMVRTVLPPGAEWADAGDKRIYFDNMDDDEALFVATEFKRMEAEAAAMRRGKLN